MEMRILIGIALAGMLLTIGLVVSGAIPYRNPFAFANRDPLAAFAKRPGESNSEHTRRCIRLVLCLPLILMGVLGFADAVLGGVVSPHPLVDTTTSRVVYGAAAFILAAATIRYSLTLGPER